MCACVCVCVCVCVLYASTVLVCVCVCVCIVWDISIYCGGLFAVNCMCLQLMHGCNQSLSCVLMCVYMCVCVVVCLHVVITEHYIIAVCPACVHLQCMSIFDCVLFAFYFLQTFVTQYGRVVKRRKPPPNVYNDFSVRFYLMRGFICATE